MNLNTSPAEGKTNAYVARIAFNDDMPQMENIEARVIFQFVETDWHHTAELTVFLPKDPGATIDELKARFLAKGREVLRKMVDATSA